MPVKAERTGVDAQVPHGDFGLSIRAIELLRRALAKHPGIVRAIVYGSRARGNYRPGSDIDLVLEAPQLTATEFAQIDLELDDLMLPYQIDLSLLHHIDDPTLREHIASVGRPLWQASESS